MQLSLLHPTLTALLALLPLLRDGAHHDRQPTALPITCSEEVVERYATGEVHLRYEVNEEGQRNGPLQEFAQDGSLLVKTRFYKGLEHGSRVEYDATGEVCRKVKMARGQPSGRELVYHPSGERKLVATWKAGKLHGDYATYLEDGRPVLSAEYRAGLLHGTYREHHASGRVTLETNYVDGQLWGERIETSVDGTRVELRTYEAARLHGTLSLVENGETLTNQEWRRGQIAKLDGIVIFPRQRDPLFDELAEILGIEEAPTGPTTYASIEEERAAGLRRLQAYRALCGVPWRELHLDNDLNSRCTDAARLNELNGKLSHRPDRPEGVTDEVYERGLEAAQNSNLHEGYHLPGSIDSYMDDSDPSNIDRVGHRRWCINPAMDRAGLGRSGRFSAMWAHKTGGSKPSAQQLVLYPPRGHVPKGLFGKEHAWSITYSRELELGQLGEPEVSLTRLGPDYLPMGEPLVVDYVNLETGGFGFGPCLIFRFGDVDIDEGAIYRCLARVPGNLRDLTVEYVVRFGEDERLVNHRNHIPK
jgi:antitoxin component YwqK of YwqJK toxin-antitoxin module